MKKLVALITAVILLLGLCSCGDGAIKIPNSSIYYMGRDYSLVTSELTEAGFTNISTEILDDLTSQSSLSDGSVESISVDGKTEFEAKERFLPDAPITITYHIIPKLCPPISSGEIQDISFTDIGQKFTDSGFTNVKVREEYDLDPDNLQSEYKNEVKINGNTSFTTADSVPFDSDIEVICHLPYEKYSVTVEIDFIPNLIFSKYDVVLSVDGQDKGTLTHGQDYTYTDILKEGKHTLKFRNSNSSSVTGEVTLDVTSELDAMYQISCYSGSIDVKTVYVDYKTNLAEDEAKVMHSEASYKNYNYKTVVKDLQDAGFTNITATPVYDIIWGITEEESVKSVTIAGRNDFRRGDIFKKDAEIVIVYHMSYEDDPANQTQAPSQTTAADKQEDTPKASESNSVFYSTNDRKTVKNGNSGVYAYKSEGGTYDNYWIIDFDEKCVYFFSDGNGDSTCNRVPMVSGDLNTVLIITYHDVDGSEWSYGMHFDWAKQPNHLVVEDESHFTTDYYVTDLEDALKIRDEKTIYNY